MSWGTELWDQFENIVAHVQKGIDLCERFSHFTKERCSIELEYANKLKRLVKSHMPKKKEDDELTTSNGFLAMIKEVHDIAGQHETISETLLASVANGSQSLAVELKQERKKAIQDGSKHLSLLQAQFAQLDKVKKNSEKAFREMEKAQEAYRKINEDQSLSRNDVDKAKQFYQLRQQAYEQSKLEYASEVQKTNAVQRDHYHVCMPQVFDNLQAMEEKRVAKMKAFILATADTEKLTIPIMNRCIEDMVRAASIVDYNKEMQLVIDKYKTGFSIPSDVPFEEISSSSCSKSSNIYGSLPGSTSSRRDKKRPGLLGMLAGSKDEGAPREDFSHLPPSQQQRQLAAKIDSLKATVAKETSERDALLKMQDVYNRNTALGDPASVAKQLEDKTQHLSQLSQELKKFEEYMVEAGRRLAPPKATTLPNANHSLPLATVPMATTPQPKSSDVQASAKAKEKPAALTKPPISRPSVTASEPKTPTPKSVSLVKMFPAEPPSAKKSLSPQRQESEDNGSGDEFIDGGTCTAIYDFDGSVDGSLAMKTGEEFTVIERDEGDGWVNVRTNDGGRGFVPATYVKYND